MFTVFRKKKKIIKKSNLFYEQEYLLNPLTNDSLNDEYLDMVLQYGYLVCFVAAFPIAPVVAMVNNILEVRTDASKFIRNHRRPVPNRVPGVGAWFEILKALTYLGVIINAVIIAFTSDFVPRLIRRNNVEYSFVNTSMSEFSMNDFVIFRSMANKSCYYPGQRYPPNHPKKYELTLDFWFGLCMRFLVVILIEHVIFFLNGVLAYAIPDVPAQVMKQLQLEEKKDKERRENLYRQQYWQML